MSDTKTYGYFIYSTKQHADRKSISENAGRKFIPGTVMVKGQKKLYTELLTKSATATTTPKSRYSDAIIIAEGYIEDIQYTEVDPI